MKYETYLSKRIGEVKVLRKEGLILLESSRLQLKPLGQDDSGQLFENCTTLLTKMQNMSLHGSGKPWSFAEITALIEKEKTKLSQLDNFYKFSVYDLANQQFMGILTIDYQKDAISGHPNAVEIGYIIDEPFWGQGFGTELAIVAKKYIKDVLATVEMNDLPQEIVATVHPENKGSYRILEKTLKNRDDLLLTRYGQPRLCFFKDLKKHMPAQLPAQEINLHPH